jgi:hypothetical protein
MRIKRIICCQRNGIKQAVSNAVDVRTVRSGALLNNIWEALGERRVLMKRLDTLWTGWRRTSAVVDDSLALDKWPDKSAVTEGIRATKAFISGLLDYSAFLCAVHATTACLQAENVEKEFVRRGAVLEGRVNKRIRYRTVRPDA